MYLQSILYYWYNEPVSESHKVHLKWLTNACKYTYVTLYNIYSEQRLVTGVNWNSSVNDNIQLVNNLLFDYTHIFIVTN